MAGCVVRARYEDIERFEHALKALKESGATDYRAYGPVNLTEFEDLMPKRGSRVELLATFGGAIGLIVFFLMCVLSALLYNLITGGKPPISNVPFVIVAYEGTILLGAIAAFVGTVYLARLLLPDVPAGYDARFSQDSFGIEVPCESADRQKTVDLLVESGASEIYESEG